MKIDDIFGNIKPQAGAVGVNLLASGEPINVEYFIDYFQEYILTYTSS